MNIMPADGTEQRKLAAIMYTDVVGYPDASGAQRNEAVALASVPPQALLQREQLLPHRLRINRASNSLRGGPRLDGWPCHSSFNNQFEL